MDALGQPAFLIEVGGQRNFAFHALHTRHQTQTGVDPALLIGKSPAAALPPRLAETLIENYWECRAAGRDLSYEEHLQLPKGAHWWHASLSPFFYAPSTVTMILAIILVLKDGFFDLGDGRSEQLSVCDRLMRSALLQIDELFHSSDTLIAHTEFLLKVDVGHLCRDILALIDPTRRIEIRLPACTVSADTTSPGLTLRQLLENALKYTTRNHK